MTHWFHPEADNIVVLSDGKIIEQARHEQLLALDGLYTQMFRRQQLEESLVIPAVRNPPTTAPRTSKLTTTTRPARTAPFCHRRILL